MERFMTVPEVADLLRVPKETVRYWHRQRTLRGFQVGKRLLFEREAVEAYIARQKGAAA